MRKDRQILVGTKEDVLKRHFDCLANEIVEEVITSSKSIGAGGE